MPGKSKKLTLEIKIIFSLVYTNSNFYINSIVKLAEDLELNLPNSSEAEFLFILAFLNASANSSTDFTDIHRPPTIVAPSHSFKLTVNASPYLLFYLFFFNLHKKY